MKLIKSGQQAQVLQSISISKTAGLQQFHVCNVDTLNCTKEIVQAAAAMYSTF